ncbi:MAG TPA: EamA family transporter [Ruminococcaceae bacterium]|jgi:drug/metabolite transporter (DMT)-like permease|nr:EamA family transporter [Oscillospiraceae bacterium]
MKKTTSLWAAGGLLFTALIWGLAFVVVKNSLDFVPPIYMMAFRFTIATAGLSLMFIGRLKNIDAAMLKSGFVLGFLLTIAYALQTIGCKYTTAGKNAFLTAAYVVFVPFLHWMVNNQKTKKSHIAAAFVAIIGIALLSLQDDLSVNIGDFLSLLCGIGFGVQIVFIEKYTKKQDPILLTVTQLAVASTLSWMAAPFFDGGLPQGILRADVVTSMLYLGLFSTMVAFFLQNVCQKYTPPSTTSILMSTESVFGILFSVLLLGERPSFRAIVGCVFIFFAIMLAQTKISKLIDGYDRAQTKG